MVVKAVTPAANVSFFDAISKLAKPVSKLSSAQAQQDPKLAARVRFANQVAEQIKLIKAGEIKTRWFTKTPNGIVTITLRNGNTAMPLNGTTYFETANVEAATKFLDAIAAGAKNGDLDEAIEKTNRAPRPKKEKVAAAPAQTPDAK